MKPSFYIPDPCHESWNQMTPQQQGRHCAVCDKVVVDFSKKTQDEIATIMDGSVGKVCGRFNVEQLDHTSQMKVFKKPSNLLNRNWKYAALAFLGVFSLARKSEAQKLKGKVAIRGDVAYTNYPANPVNKTQKTLTGHVDSDMEEHVQGVQINLYQEEQLVASGKTLANGRYVLKMQPGTLKGNKVRLEAIHEDYMTKRVEELVLEKDSTTLNLSMHEMMMIKGEIAFPEDPIKEDIIEDPVFSEPVIEDPAPTCAGIPEINPDSLALQSMQYMVLGQVAIKAPEPVVAAIEDFTPEEENTISAIVPLPLGLEELDMKLYPNPAGTYVVLETGDGEGFSYEIFNYSGALITKETVQSSQKRLDVSAWTPGTYICVAREGDRARTLKLVITR